jgi:peptidoglycan LD-endopeptidase LytH
MNRERRRGGPVLLAGLGGFALGAATVLFVVWVYGVRHPAALGGAAPPPPVSQNPAPPVVQAAPNAAPPLPPAEQGGPAPPSPSPAATASDVDVLRHHGLLLPLQGVQLGELRDSFDEGRGGHRHEALDIMAPRNTPVLAVEDGRLVKLFFSRQGGNTIYQFDPSETFAYYYAHLERYAEGIREGEPLRRGQVIGYVGTSGNAPPGAPHLHFAIQRLTPEKHWWQGTAINPYLVFKP